MEKTAGQEEDLKPEIHAIGILPGLPGSNHEMDSPSNGTPHIRVSCMRTHTHIRKHTHTHTHIHTHNAHTYASTCARAHTHKYTHTQTCTTTHTQHSCMARGGRAFKEMRSVPFIFESYPKVRMTFECAICVNINVSLYLSIYRSFNLFHLSLSFVSHSLLSQSRSDPDSKQKT